MERIYVVIHPDSEQSSALSILLGNYGKAFEAHSKEELDSILKREGFISALFIAFEPNAIPLHVVRGLKKEFQVPVYMVGDVPLTRLGEIYETGVSDLLPLPLDAKWIEKHFVQERGDAQTTIPSDFRLPEPAAKYTPMDLGEDMPKKMLERLVVVTSPKGGEGKTTFLAQLGMGLARKGFRPIGLDAGEDGNLARWIGEGVSGSITEFQNERHRKDRESLDMMLSKHKKTGFQVLASPLNSIEPITWKTVKSAYETYKQYYSLFLIDLSEGYTPVFEQLAKNYATDIFLITTPEFARIERTIAMAEKCKERKIPLHKIHVIVNKVKKPADMQAIRARLEDMGFQVYALPYHEELADATELEIAPIFSDLKSSYTKQFFKIVSETMGITFGGNPKQKESIPESTDRDSLSLLSRLFERLRGARS